MKTFYIGLISMMLIVVAMVLFPNFHTMLGLVNTNGMQPLVKSAIAFAPYFLLFMAGYGIYKMVKG